MRVPVLHRLLGLAQLYARQETADASLRDLATTDSKSGSRLANQENAMSKIAPILAALALSVPALAAAQKKEADDVKKVSDTLDQFLASKTEGDPITGDEIAQLQGFSDAIKAAADGSTARANDLEGLVAKIPAEDAPTQSTGDPTAPSEPDAKPVGGEAAAASPTTVDADPSMASTIPDGDISNG